MSPCEDSLLEGRQRRVGSSKARHKKTLIKNVKTKETQMDTIKWSMIFGNYIE